VKGNRACDERQRRKDRKILHVYEITHTLLANQNDIYHGELIGWTLGVSASFEPEPARKNGRMTQKVHSTNAVEDPYVCACAQPPPTACNVGGGKAN
jgi:hypothetical protein